MMILLGLKLAHFYLQQMCSKIVVGLGPQGQER